MAMRLNLERIWKLNHVRTMYLHHDGVDRKISITRPLCHATVQAAFPLGTFGVIGQ